MLESDSKKKLKIGLMLDSYAVEAWQYSLIEWLINSQYTELKLIIYNKSAKATNKFLKVIQNPGKFVYYLHKALDQALFRVKRNAFAKLNSRNLLTGIAVIDITPIHKGFSDFFPQESIDKIKNCELDIIVRMGFNILKGPILQSSKYGIWSYHHGDNRTNRGSPAAYWEIMQNKGEIGTVLLILSEDLDGGKVIYRSWAQIHPYSLTVSKNICFWRSVSFLKRTVKDLYLMGWDKFLQKIDVLNQGLDIYDRPICKSPSNLAAIGFAIKQTFNSLKWVYRKIFYLNQWILFYDFSSNLSVSIRKFRKIVPPKDRFWADPFILFHNGKYYVFIEEYMYSNQKGHIAAISIDEDGKFTNLGKVLECSYHLSYPFVFSYQNKFYMIPETGENRTIELYESLEFPLKWQHKLNLMDNIIARDSTLFYHNGKWWLFTAIDENDAGISDELFLFYSEDLFSSDWQPHPLNPIISDVKTARPAGNIFTLNNKIYRPSQDCSYTSGKSININEIEVLNEFDYRERIISKIEPQWDKLFKRTHTFSFDNRLIILDAARKIRKFP